MEEFRYKKFVQISEILDNQLLFKNIKEAQDSRNIVSDFAEVFPELKGKVVARNIINKTLTLKTFSSVWKSEMRFKTSEVIEKLNTFYSKNIIEKIKII